MGPHASDQVAERTPAQRVLADGPVRLVLDSLRRIVRDLRLGEAEYSAGLSVAQRFVLKILADQPATSVTQLAERTLTDQSSVSVVVKRLALRKLVVRKASRLDGRRTEVSLTRTGRKLLARLPEPAPSRLLGALRRLSPAELRKLVDGLTAVVVQMGLENAAPKMFSEDDVPRARRGGRPRRGE